ncbi:hypothetical protein Tco_0288257, partial [Tanacetum coccineum]
MLFQPLFDEFLNPSPSVDHPAPEVVAPSNEVIAPVLVTSTGQPYGDYFEVDLQSETRRTGRNFEEQSLISSP